MLRPGKCSCDLVITTTPISLLGINSELLDSKLYSDVPDKLDTVFSASDSSPLATPLRVLSALSPLHHPVSDPQEMQVTRASSSLHSRPIIPHLPT